MKRKASQSSGSGKRAKPSITEQAKEKKLTVVLDKAFLETVYTKERYELLNCDDHARIMKKHHRDVADARPDILHQCLLMLMDSPLNKAGYLQVYVRTKQNVLIKIHAQTRIPRTFKRFAGLMVQLLHELKINSVQDEGTQTLLQVIKNPVTAYLPIGCPKIGTSVKGKLINAFVKERDYQGPVTFVIGAMPHGGINEDFTEELISVSSYPLSGALACSKICGAFESHWGVL